MSHITTIKGWIEIIDCPENDFNFKEAIEHLKCSHGFAFRCPEYCEHEYKTVPNMFTRLPDSGDKQPGYIVFAATINNAVIDDFTEFFEEELLTRLSGLQAFVFISTEQTKSFCKRYKGKRKEGDWELAETIDFYTDDINESSLEAYGPEWEFKDVKKITKMFLRLF